MSVNCLSLYDLRQFDSAHDIQINSLIHQFSFFYRIYKGTFPTCHDFGPVTEESEIVPLVVGFSGGQIQLVDPIRKELSKLFNEEVRKDFFFLV